MRKTKLYVWILLSAAVFIVSGCEKEDPKGQISEYEVNKHTQELKGLLEKKNQEIIQLSEQVEKIKNELPSEQLKKAIVDCPWLQRLQDHHTKWDKIVISRYDGDEEQITIEDPLFLEHIPRLLHLKRLSDIEFSNGYQSDIESYIYDLYQGDNKYRITVVDRGIIKAGCEGLYFEVSKDAHLLGQSFMPAPIYLKHHGLIAKISESGAVQRGEKYIQISGYRVKAFARTLALNGEKFQSAPKVGDKIETFTFYYFGDKIFMDVYLDHVLLKSDTEETWYFYENAGYLLTAEAG